MLDRYLYYSYSPECSQNGLAGVIRDAIQRDIKTKDSADLIDDGKKALKKSINRELAEDYAEREHVIPLSSGLDSRLILALLLDHPEIDPNSITTVSFGSPGTWDFEIGQEVANKAGVRNIAVDLTANKFDWSLSSLRTYVRTLDQPTRVFEGYANAYILSIVRNNSVIWSGFMGDPTVGGHQPDEPTEDWSTACEYFAEVNQFAEGLSSPSFDPVSILPNQPYLDRSYLSYEEQLDFAHRQPCLIAPLVLPEPDRYRTPFMQPEWLSYSLNLPRKSRKNRSLFTDIVTNMYPSLFSLPTDANHGLPINTRWVKKFIHRSRLFISHKILQVTKSEYCPPNTNYLNFGRAFREMGQLRDSVRTLMNDFSEREIAGLFEPTKIWDDHQSGNDRTDQIRAICSVELILSETNLITCTKV